MFHGMDDGWPNKTQEDGRKEIVFADVLQTSWDNNIDQPPTRNSLLAANSLALCGPRCVTLLLPLLVCSVCVGLLFTLSSVSGWPEFCLSR